MLLVLCRSGGIGRRTRLKILRGQLHEGSSPSFGTKANKKTGSKNYLFFYFIFLNFHSIVTRMSFSSEVVEAKNFTIGFVTSSVTEKLETVTVTI